MTVFTWTNSPVGRPPKMVELRPAKRDAKRTEAAAKPSRSLDRFNLMSIKAHPKWLAAIACMVVFALAIDAPGAVAHAQETGSSVEPGQTAGYDEAEARAIDRMLMCPVCPAESIDQAQVELARQMRQVVREMLSQGASRDEILDFFEDNYGTNVLAAPPKSGFNLLAWLLPAAAVLAALAAGLLVIRSMTVQGVDSSVASIGANEGLEPYLEAIDRDLGLTEGSGSTGSTGTEPEAEQPPLEEGLRRDG